MDGMQALAAVSGALLGTAQRLEDEALHREHMGDDSTACAIKVQVAAALRNVEEPLGALLRASGQW